MRILRKSLTLIFKVVDSGDPNFQNHLFGLEIDFDHWNLLFFFMHPFDGLSYSVDLLSFIRTLLIDQIQQYVFENVIVLI